MRKTSRATAKEDREFRLTCMDRARNRCEHCGSPLTEMHHGAGRVGKLLVDARCGVILCHECHHWITNNPLSGNRWLEDMLPSRWADIFTAKRIGWQEDYAAERERRGIVPNTGELT